MATQMVEYEEQPPIPSQATLVVRPGTGLNENSIVLNEGVNVVGRQPMLGAKERAIIVGDPTVSARHALIEVKQGMTTFTDVSSRGQTFLHDGVAWRKQESGARLFIYHGIYIRFGLVVCRILLNDSPPPPVPPPDAQPSLPVNSALLPTQAHDAHSGDLGATQPYSADSAADLNPTLAYVGSQLYEDGRSSSKGVDELATQAYDKDQPVNSLVASISGNPSSSSSMPPPQPLIRGGNRNAPAGSEPTQLYDASTEDLTRVPSDAPVSPPARQQLSALQRLKSVTISDLPSPRALHMAPSAALRQHTQVSPADALQAPKSMYVGEHAGSTLLIDDAPPQAVAGRVPSTITDDEPVDEVKRTETGTFIADWDPTLSPRKAPVENSHEAPEGCYRTESGTMVISDEHSVTPLPKSGTFVVCRSSPTKPRVPLAFKLAAASPSPTFVVPPSLSSPSQSSIKQTSDSLSPQTASSTSKPRFSHSLTSIESLDDIDSFVASATQSAPSSEAISPTTVAAKPAATASVAPVASVSAVRKPSAKLMANLQARREELQAAGAAVPPPGASHALMASFAQHKALSAVALEAVAAVAADLGKQGVELQPQEAPKRGARKRRGSVAKEASEEASEVSSQEKQPVAKSGPSAAAGARRGRGKRKVVVTSEEDEGEEVELSPGRMRPAAAGRGGRAALAKEKEEKKDPQGPLPSMPISAAVSVPMEVAASAPEPPVPMAIQVSLPSASVVKEAEMIESAPLAPRAEPQPTSPVSEMKETTTAMVQQKPAGSKSAKKEPVPSRSLVPAPAPAPVPKPALVPATPVPVVEQEEKVVTVEMKRTPHKRVKKEDVAVPTPEKKDTPDRNARKRYNTTSELTDSSQCRKDAPKDASPAVLFTGLSAEDVASYIKIVTALGGTVVETARECTHLITDKVHRTLKFLECLVCGNVITSVRWLDASHKAGSFVDPTLKEYQIHDKEAEHKWNFSLSTSLTRAKAGSLLAGLSFWITRSTKPAPADLKAIIVSGGGKVLTKQPRFSQPEVLIVTCKEDEAVFSPLITKGFNAVSVEFMLSAILRQELDRDFLKLEKCAHFAKDYLFAPVPLLTLFRAAAERYFVPRSWRSEGNV